MEDHLQGFCFTPPYGVTQTGGANNAGEVFELKSGSGGWTLQVLYSFCSLANCDDGATPRTTLTYAGAISGLQYDGSSPLYGTTEAGAGTGAAYSLQPGEQSWTEQVIYAFGDTSSEDSPLLLDSSGNLYGTEVNNDLDYELTPSGNGWLETTIYSFPCPPRCRNGNDPAGGLVMGPSGELWGTTTEGGRICQMPHYSGYGCGVLYSLSSGQRRYRVTERQ